MQQKKREKKQWVGGGVLEKEEDRKGHAWSWMRQTASNSAAILFPLRKPITTLSVGDCVQFSLALFSKSTENKEI